MQPVFSMLMNYARDLQRIGDGNVNIVKKGDKVFMNLPGTNIQCNYLAPWLNGDIKYGMITDKHRIEYINIIGKLYEEYYNDDQFLYFEVIDNVVSIYRLTTDLSMKVLYKRFNLVPITGWLWTTLLSM